MLQRLPSIVFVATVLACPFALSQSAPSDDLFDLSLEQLMTLEVAERQPYRGELPLDKLPQAVEILSSDFLQTRGISSFQDALDTSSAVARQNHFGGLWDGFAIRGFSGDENLPGGYFVNGFSAGRGFSGRRDTANIQSIEVLKGTGAAFYGRSEPGGTINIITKKPQFHTSGYLEASAGSYDNYRLEADYTTAASEHLAWRVNGAYEDAGSFRNTLSSNRLSLNPSLLYRISDRSHLSYEVEILEQDIPFDRAVVVLNNDFDRVSPERFFGEPNDGPIEVKATGQQLVFQHAFNQKWNLLAGFGYRASSLEGYSTEAELSKTRQLLFRDGETLSRQRRFRDFDATDLSSRVELTGLFTLGGQAHHLLIGLDAYEYELTQIQQTWRVAPGDNTYAVAFAAPVYGQPQPALNPFWDRQEQEDATGMYVQDQIELNEQWQLLAGFRVDRLQKHFEDFLSDDTTHQTHNGIIPRAGFNYQATPSYSFYASYSEGFRPNSGTDARGDAFSPEQSNSYEMGLKFTSRDQRVSSNIALYRAEKSNLLTSDPINSGFSLALGKAESQGLDINLSIQFDGDNEVSFNYLYVDAQTVNDMINPVWSVKVPAGSPLINIPQQQANLTFINSFTVSGHHSNWGANVSYVDERLGETIDPNYILPSYTLVRVFSTVELTKKMQLSLNINNLFNEQYFPSSYSALWTQPGSPRTIFLKMRYRFD
ncbi:TonB-dependent siderophore receptor [Cellvibrio sp.]